MRTQSTTPDNRLDEESKERVKGNFRISRRYIIISRKHLIEMLLYTLELCKVKIAGWRCGIWKNNWTILGSDLKICHLFTQSFKHTFIQHLVGTRWVMQIEFSRSSVGPELLHF